jgi:hypothetical protein
MVVWTSNSTNRGWPRDTEWTKSIFRAFMVGSAVKVAIYDGILESHLALSLERALVRRGHDVYNTGRIGSGFTFPSDVETIRRLNNALDQVLDFSPDVILVFRPASMPFSLLKRARASKAILMAWFSDDPVLWNLSYGPVVDFYDVVLHCGNSQVLRFYEKQHGRPTGINFPFWTDNASFPYVYGQNPADSEAMFLGNVRGQVRRQRYLDLAELVSDVKIYGGVDEDTHKIWGGYLDSDAEVADAASRSLIGLNIPQFFSDHEGMPTWFEGLGALTFFQYPSRVIQYAAMGLPIISMVPDSKYLETFPEILCARDPAELDRTIRLLVDETDLIDLSRRTHERFRQNYSSDARVLALEALVEHDVDWRSMDVEARTSLYMEYPVQPDTASTHNFALADSGAGITPMSLRERLKVHLSDVPKAERPLRIAVAGTGWSHELSDVSITVRALRHIGHHVVELNPFRKPECFDDYSGDKATTCLNVGPVLEMEGEGPDIIILVGDWVAIRSMDARVLSKAGCILLHLASPAKSAGPSEQQKAALMNRTTVLDPAVALSFREQGFTDVSYLPKLVDRAFVAALLGVSTASNSPSDGVGFLASRPADLEFYESFVSSLGANSASTYALHEESGGKDSLAKVARICRSGKVVTFPESRSKRSSVNPMLGYALVSGSLPITIRRAASPLPEVSEQYFVSVNDENEALEKIRRVDSGAAWTHELIDRALHYGLGYFSAEEQLTRVLAEVMADRT